MKKILSKVLILFVCGLLCSCQLIVKPVLPSTSSSSNNSTISGSSTSSSSSSSSSSSTSSSSNSSITETTHVYNDFTANEKAELESLFGFVIPFIPNSKYYLERYYQEYEEFKHNGFNFYTYGNTQAEFNDYLKVISNSGFISDGTDVDDYGDTWYLYSKGNIYFDTTYYFYENEYVIDVYVYYVEELGNTDVPNDHKYQNFAYNEVSRFNDMFGFVIPFIPTDEYYIDNYGQEYNGKYEEGLNFYTYNNTEAEYKEYLTKIANSGFTIDGTDIDSYGDTWYYYSKGEVFLDISYYYYEYDEAFLVDVYVYYKKELGDIETPTYTNFTSSEASMFNDMFGFVIPFVPNSEYYVEEYSMDLGDKEEIGINFYTYGNSQEDFYDFMYALSQLEFMSDDTYEDSYGDRWYCFVKGDVYLDVAYYKSDDYNSYVIDVYIYRLHAKEYNPDGDTSNNKEIITNEGAGLPTGENGIYNVNFNDATQVKDVRDQGAYQGGCPTEGDVRVLVIPVEFSDRTAASLGYDIDKLETAFNGDNKDTTYYSVSNYFKESSYGKLNLTFDIYDGWFRPEYASSYYANYYADIGGEDVWLGDQVVMDEALKYLSQSMDLSIYDSDNNSMIDAVVLISTNEINSEYDFTWAARYWNFYTDDNGYKFEYDDVSANDYVWCPYQFMFEKEKGEYDGYDIINPLTFIHEFSHILGADDYYNYNGYVSPLENHDIMDSMTSDHNPYTKINYGWIKNSKLIVTDSSVTLNLNSFIETGETIIIANNWDSTLGAYQEYYILMYYKNESLNLVDNVGLFKDEGILMYHVNASLYFDEAYGYNVYNNNNTIYGGDYDGTEDNLIEFVKFTSYQIIYTQGCTSSADTIDDQGNRISYTFTVDSLTDEYATITFNKNN